MAMLLRNAFALACAADQFFEDSLGGFEDNFGGPVGGIARGLSLMGRQPGVMGGPPGGGTTYYLRQERTVSNPAAGISETHRFVKDSTEGTETVGVRRTFRDEYIDKERVVHRRTGTESTSITNHNVHHSTEPHWTSFWESEASRCLPPYNRQPLAPYPHPSAGGPSQFPRGGQGRSGGRGGGVDCEVASIASTPASERQQARIKCADWLRSSACGSVAASVRSANRENAEPSVPRRGRAAASVTQNVASCARGTPVASVRSIRDRGSSVARSSRMSQASSRPPVWAID
eukprot:Hpha_TRINITY_DN15343_c2_g6::TRINITY_DN15343_c2_g6_i2::g.88352::m.88352